MRVKRGKYFPPSREHFLPCRYAKSGATATEYGIEVDGASEEAWAVIYLPAGFVSLELAAIIFQPIVTVDPMKFGFTAYYGAVGEAWDTHEASLTPQGPAVAGALASASFGTTLDALAGGDVLRVKMGYSENTDAYFVGIRLKYTIL